MMEEVQRTVIDISNGYNELEIDSNKKEELIKSLYEEVEKLQQENQRLSQDLNKKRELSEQELDINSKLDLANSTISSQEEKINTLSEKNEKYLIIIANQQDEIKNLKLKIPNINDDEDQN